MKTIFARQNLKENIDRLAAQRQLYIEAKKAFLMMIYLAIPVAVLIAFTKILLAVFFKIDITAFVNIYSVGVTISELLIVNPYINRFKTDAASVQEEFDCDVYQMPWHGIIVGKKVKKEIVNKYVRLFKESGGDLSRLYDWYPIELSHKEHFRTILLCQKTNLNYDQAIRTSFKNLVLKVTIYVFVILVVAALFFNYSVWDFIVKLFMSCLPVFTIAIKIILDHNKTIKNSINLQNTIESLIEDNQEIQLSDIRSVQDKIYTSRKEAGLIPEIFYNRIRKKLEDEMHENAASF